MKEKWTKSMATVIRKETLLDRYEFLERVAISCMGKKYITNQQVMLPSKAKSIANRVNAYAKMESLLINYLVIDSDDKKLLQSLLKENEAILRYLHAQDFYFDSNKKTNQTYLAHITIPLFVLRLTLLLDHSNSFIKQLFMMLQASIYDYPSQLKQHVKSTIAEQATELGLKSKPTEWVNKIRLNSYPTMSTYTNDLSNWTESQTASKNKIDKLIRCTNEVYRSGLLVKALRDITGDYPSYQCVTEQKTKLLSSGGENSIYRTIMRTELNHVDAGDFLSTNKRKYDSPTAHKMLFTHNNGLFAPYCFQQQLKNQLNTSKRIIRLESIFLLCGTTKEKNEAYFNSLDIKEYMIRALFSAALTFTNQVLTEIYDKYEGKFTEVLSQIKQEITTESIEDSTERAIINILSLIVEELHKGWDAGDACRELAVFLYCFRINEQSTQPNTGELPERVFWDTNEKEYDEKIKFIHCIADYNTFIINYIHHDLKADFLCNPFKRLEDCLKAHFESNQQDFKKSVNAAFKKKRAVIVNTLNKTPYDALKDIQKDVTSMKLAPYLNQLLPNIMHYILLSDEKKEAILELLKV